MNTVNCTYSFIGGGWQNCICAPLSTISGGYKNLIYDSIGFSVIQGGCCNQVLSCKGMIGGGAMNKAYAYSYIGSGSSHLAQGIAGFIGGGNCNNICNSTDGCLAYGSVIGGGVGNNTQGGTWSMATCTFSGAPTICNSGPFSFIGGGFQNWASCSYTTIGGGYKNIASGQYSFVGGGKTNTASGSYSTISGGHCNLACGNFTFIGGGRCNSASGYISTISGGWSNVSAGDRSSVGGGQINNAYGNFTFIGGGYGSTASGSYSTISGGYGNLASGNYSTVVGGYCNYTQYDYAFLGGGCKNTISTYGCFGVLGGGSSNIVCSCWGVIAGGLNNKSIGKSSFIGGGESNCTCGYGFVGGGYNNTASGYAGVISGGQGNSLAGNFGVIGGGCGNSVCACYGFIGGGQQNCIDSNGLYSSIAGGLCNHAYCQSGFAVGYNNNICANFSGAIGCSLVASCPATLYVNNLCACGSLYTSAISTGCAVCVTTGGQLVGFTGGAGGSRTYTWTVSAPAVGDILGPRLDSCLTVCRIDSFSMASCSATFNVLYGTPGSFSTCVMGTDLIGACTGCCCTGLSVGIAANCWMVLHVTGVSGTPGQLVVTVSGT